MKRKWDRLTEEQRKAAREDLIYFFESKRNEKIGVIAADNLLDFILKNIGTKLYNRGISDARTAMESRLDELTYDLEDLME